MTGHPDPSLVRRYGAADNDLDGAVVWAVESHLETCASCRALLAAALPTEATALLARVHQAVAERTAAGPPPAAARRVLAGRYGVALAVLPWLVTVAGVLGAALLFERVVPTAPSLTLMVAPVTPLLAVAAAWTRSTDPAWEIVASTPRAGLRMLLHRTLIALAAVTPLLAAAGAASGHTTALWLMPCLAFTAGSLALGGLIGVARAAAALTAAWTTIVILPSLWTNRLPALLDQASWPVWLVAAAALFVVALLRADDHRRLTSRH
ncbi:zf-HC2 domain-containing protein [Micromonospora marina]|uniref:zf-HC2 domain-containing protein n=1 Tax=Micromonospora marina TaxID=307120 RepID=UPI00345543D3